MKRHHPRRGILLAGAMIVLSGAAALAPPADAAHVRNVTERMFPFQPGGTVAIESQNGRIAIEAWSRPEVRVQITREVRASGEDRARELMKHLSADVEVAPDRIEIESVYPKRKEVVGFFALIGRGIQAANIHYYIQVPRETSLELRTSNGEIRVRGTNGDLTGTTLNGDIEVAAVTGGMELETTNGEIRLMRVEGPTQAVTTNGSVTADLTRLPARGRLSLETTNGNVKVTLPAGLRAALEASTTNGRVSVAFPVTTQGVITSKTMHGTIGGGGALRLKLQTTNGNITVARAETRRAS